MATILIIDDTPSEVELIRRILTAEGHTCLVAANGSDGESLAEAHFPALILMDIVMPNQDGFVTCRRIKRNPPTAQIPIILMSVKNTESDRFWGLKQGALDYLPKPFSESDLLAIVQRALAAAA